MSLIISLVEPGKRPWASWLGSARKIRLLESAQLGEQGPYLGSDRHVVFIHGAREKDKDTYEAMWRGLADSKHRVWWLFYSGGGYYRVRSDVGNIHFLKYEVTTTLGQSEVASIRQFLSSMEGNEEPTPPDCWDALYPPDNTSLVALYAILTASTLNVPIDDVVDRLSNGPELLKAYNQYERLRRNPAERPQTLNEWERALSAHRYGELRDELRRTLGGVPD